MLETDRLLLVADPHVAHHRQFGESPPQVGGGDQRRGVRHPGEGGGGPSGIHEVEFGRPFNLFPHRAVDPQPRPPEVDAIMNGVAQGGIVVDVFRDGEPGRIELGAAPHVHSEVLVLGGQFQPVVPTGRHAEIAAHLVPLVLGLGRLLVGRLVPIRLGLFRFVGDGIVLEALFLRVRLILRRRVDLEQLLILQSPDQLAIRPFQFLDPRPQVVRVGDGILGNKILGPQAQQAGQCGDPAPAPAPSGGSPGFRARRRNRHQRVLRFHSRKLRKKVEVQVPGCACVFRCRALFWLFEQSVVQGSHGIDHADPIEGIGCGD